MFYFFSRAVFFPDLKIKLFHGLHFLPLLLVFITPQGIVVPTAFLIGTTYCLWLTNIIYRLRSAQKRFGLILSFFSFFTILAVLVLVFGFASSYVNSSYFYYFYTLGIGFSLVLVTGTLFVFPNVLNEVDEIVRLGYASTTLGKIDVEASKAKLEHLMLEEKIYQNETLSLALIADEMKMSNHQISELINSQFDMGFSQYIRSQRVEAAKQLLVSEPSASILSISMQVGFNSQSNFYAAFKGLTGESPGNYRKSGLQ